MVTVPPLAATLMPALEKEGAMVSVPPVPGAMETLVGVTLLLKTRSLMVNGPSKVVDTAAPAPVALKFTVLPKPGLPRALVVPPGSVVKLVVSPGPNAAQLLLTAPLQ